MKPGTGKEGGVPVKILQLGMSANHGGVESFVLNYAKEMNKYGVSCDYVDLQGKGLAGSEWILSEGSRIFTLKDYRKHPIQTLKRVKQIVREGNYDCVHINLLSAASLVPTYGALRGGAKVLVHSHNSQTIGLPRKLLHGFHSVILRRLPVTRLACGNMAGNWMHGKKKFEVVPNAIDTQRYRYSEESRKARREELGIGEDTFVLGFVGRLSPQKNPVYLTKILNALRRRGVEDVKLLIVKKDHFELTHFGGPGIRVTPKANGKGAKVTVDTWHIGEGTVEVSILDADGEEVFTGSAESEKGLGESTHAKIIANLAEAHRWDGLADPYLYTAKAVLVKDGEASDIVETKFGVREFKFDAKQGFFLNGRSYPLHGVSRHQDRKGLGNAITKEMHDEDMALIREVGANTIRLAHYQHDQYFYDLCDKYGMIVWAEIPYISEHMPNGRENTKSQMKELIIQNYNHPSIVCWGISNEITISTKDHADMMDNHKMLNDMIHKMDPTRLTTLACYAMCNPFDSVVHKVSDLVGYNLYLGWYVPFPWLNDLFLGFFHKMWPKRRLCYSEYGAEGMPNLHARKPRRGDQTEDYQAIYHEYMLKCFKRHPWMWGTYVWNMFDFAADARDQGGEPGMNHKGLVTFDRKIKKDSFYLYKAWWSKEKFVHIASKRYAERPDTVTTIKVYSTEKTVKLLVNGSVVGEQTSDEHVFTFKVPLEGEIKVEAVAGECTDTATFKKVDKMPAKYILPKKKNPQKSNWV